MHPKWLAGFLSHQQFQGRTPMLPGSSRFGKSTNTASATRRGVLRDGGGWGFWERLGLVCWTGGGGKLGRKWRNNRRLEAECIGFLESLDEGAILFERTRRTESDEYDIAFFSQEAALHDRMVADVTSPLVKYPCCFLLPNHFSRRIWFLNKRIIPCKSTGWQHNKRYTHCGQYPTSLRVVKTLVNELKSALGSWDCPSAMTWMFEYLRFRLSWTHCEGTFLPFNQGWTHI